MSRSDLDRRRIRNGARTANLVLGGYLDVAVRDLVMAVGAFTLARLQEVRTAASSTAGHRRHAPA